MVEVWTTFLIISSLQDFVSFLVPLKLEPLIFTELVKMVAVCLGTLLTRIKRQC